MLLVSFGSPSAISYAVTSIVRQIMQTCLGGHATFHVANLEDFKAKWHACAAEDRTAVLVVSDCPHPDIVELFAATRGPILVASDSFRQIVRYVIRARDMEFPYAVRFATQVVCALSALSRAPNILRVTPDCYEKDLTSFAASVVEFTGMRCSDAQFETAMHVLCAGAGSKETLRHFVERLFPHAGEGIDESALSAEDRQSLEVLEERYGALAEVGDFDEVTWPTRLFLDWEKPGTFLDRTIDLLGPARFIICGPYLHLPPGLWRMSVDFETSDCLSHNELGADVFSGRILAAVSLQLPKSGRYGFHLDFQVTDPLLPVELRVQLLTGAIEGSFRLLDVRLSRRSAH